MYATPCSSNCCTAVIKITQQFPAFRRHFQTILFVLLIFHFVTVQRILLKVWLQFHRIHYRSCLLYSSLISLSDVEITHLFMYLDFIYCIMQKYLFTTSYPSRSHNKLSVYCGIFSQLCILIISRSCLQQKRSNQSHLYIIVLQIFSASKRPRAKIIYSNLI